MTRAHMSRRDVLERLVALGFSAPFADPARWPQPVADQSSDARARRPAPAVRILAFDVFGTVVDWRSGVVAAGNRLASPRGLRVDWGAFADAWREAYSPSMDRVRRGELPWTKLDVLQRQTLDALIPHFGLEALSRAERDELNHAWHRLPPWPDAIEGLTRLRRRFITTTLSNGNMSLLTDMAKNAGLPWDCILSAELVRHYTPDREAYLQVPEFLDVAPDQVLMVAAHPRDLAAARQAGLRTAYVHRPLEFGPRTEPPAAPAGGFHYVARDFLDLATQLEV